MDFEIEITAVYKGQRVIVKGTTTDDTTRNIAESAMISKATDTLEALVKKLENDGCSLSSVNKSPVISSNTDIKPQYQPRPVQGQSGEIVDDVYGDNVWYKVVNKRDGTRCLAIYNPNYEDVNHPKYITIRSDWNIC